MAIKNINAEKLITDTLGTETTVDTLFSIKNNETVKILPSSLSFTESQISDLQDYLINITGESIKSLSDVFSSMSPIDGQVLTFDSINGWQSETPSTGVIDHELLSNIGVNTHIQIDSHINDSTLHFIQGDISITESQISDLQPYLLNITSESIGDLSDVTVAASVARHVLVNNGGGGWTNRSLVELDISDLQSYLLPTDIDTFVELQTLVADETISKVGDNISDFVNDSGYITSETDSQTLSWVDGINTLSITGGNSVVITGFADLVHTHTFASLTSKPTTISGYGITDFNSLWDARLVLKSTANLSEGTNLYYTDLRVKTHGDTLYSVLAHTHTFASLTSKPTTISGYGITDFNSLWDTRLGTKSTTNLTEGTNLYYTEGRVALNSAVVLNTAKISNIVQTSIVGIGGTKTQYNTSLSDGTFMFVGDAPTAHTLDSHSNVTITTIATNELLKWNGTTWVNNTLSEANIEPLFSKNTGFNLVLGTGAGQVAEGNHTHTFASLTSKPTTIAGYGITDFNSLGDARWMAIGQQLAVTKAAVSTQFLSSYNSITGVFTSAQADYTELLNIPSTFAPSAHTLDSHSNVTITTIASNEIIKWSGTAWINNTLAEAGISATGHTHTFASLTSKPTTLLGYGIIGNKSEFDTALTDGNFAYQSDISVFSLDADVVHLAGNETITGQKTFDTGSILTNITSNNSGNGTGILGTNSSTGTAIATNNSSTGIGVKSDNSSTGIGILSINSSTGEGIVSNGLIASTGNVFVGQNNSIDTFTVDKLGNVIGNTFESEVATGTAPFTVASTTKVTNLNADLLDNLNSSQFLRSDAADTKTAGNLLFSSGVTSDYNGKLKIFGGTTQAFMDLFSADLFIRDNATNRFILGRTTGNFTAVGQGIFNAKVTAGDGTNNTSNLFEVNGLNSNVKFSGNTTPSDGALWSFKQTGTSAATRFLVQDANNASDRNTFEFLGNGGLINVLTGTSNGNLTSDGNFISQGTGTNSFNGNLNVNGVIRTDGYTVAGLPSGTQGDRTFVTDANSTTFMSIVAAGGSNIVPVFYNGTNWVIG